jgi:integrase
MSKKRGQGEGSIYKRKNGLWAAQISVHGERISKYFKTQRDGLDWLQQMRIQVRSGLTLSGSQLTLKAYLEQWLGSIRASVRPKTLEQYDQVARFHIIPTLGQIKLKDLRPDQIQALYNKKLDGGTSARTTLLIHAVLHRSLNQALKQGIVIRNPAQAVNRPKIRRKEMKTLTDGQVRALLSVVKGTRFEALFWLAVTTGIRQGELLGLRWSDLDWLSRKLRIQRQLQRISTGQVFSEPKSAAGRRLVILGIETIQKLRMHYDLQLQDRQGLGERWQENDLIFPSTLGTPWDQRNLHRCYKGFLKMAGLPDLRFHDLRHTAATLMLQQGVHPKIVQERLGHSDITLTLNTYSHVLPAMQEDAAEKLDNLLMPIDVSDEIKRIGEASRMYAARSAR